ncbi:MAG TPA: 4-alpha-glucanotransferase [Actinomycetales bacterium]|nr:4-alpha-glucanotransferase [Actinomycetales bacterium]
MTNGEEHHAQPDRDPWREVIPSCTVARAGARDQVAVHVRHGDEAVLTLTALRAPNVDAAPLKGDAGIELPQLDVWHEPRQIGDELIGRATFEIPADTAAGYYRAELISDTRSAAGLVLLTPAPADEMRREWGLSVDLPQLRSRRSWGIGDLGDLGELAVLAASWGADFIYARPDSWRTLRFEGEAEAPENFISDHVRSRYLPPALLRLEEIPELSYLSAPDRALIEWEAEEFAKLNAQHQALPVGEVIAAKAASLDLICTVELSPARQLEFEAFIAREGQSLADFALWAAIAQRCGRTGEQWPEDAAEPDAFGARRARDELESEIANHQRYQWYLFEQLARAHHRARGAGMTLGIMRHVDWDASETEIDGVSDWFAAASGHQGPLLIAPHNAGENVNSLLGVLAIEAARKNVQVLLDVPHDSPLLEAAQAVGIPTTVALQLGASMPHNQLLQISTPLDIPLANYLAEEFSDQLPTDFDEEQAQELLRRARATHDQAVRKLSEAGLIDEDFSQRSLIEALHAWALASPSIWTEYRLRDIVGQRIWHREAAGHVQPLLDGFEAPVLLDELDQLPMLRSLLRRL